MIGLPLVLLLAAHNSVAAPPEDTSPSVASDEELSTELWQGEIGRGLKGNTTSFEVRMGRAFGTTSTGSNSVHDLWLTEFQFGLILADVMEPGYWFGGNVEGIGKVITAVQERPHNAYLF